MVKTTLALRENIIEVAVYLIKHTFFIDFRDRKGKGKGVVKGVVSYRKYCLEVSQPLQNTYFTCKH